MVDQNLMNNSVRDETFHLSCNSVSRVSEKARCDTREGKLGVTAE